LHGALDIDIDAQPMANHPLLLRLPEELIRRFKRQVPPRQRSLFVQDLLERSLPPDAGEDDPLFQAALAVERDERLAAEMADWDAAAGDGLAVEGERPPPPR
jgi:hypothetical protein